MLLATFWSFTLCNFDHAKEDVKYVGMLRNVVTKQIYMSPLFNFWEGSWAIFPNPLTLLTNKRFAPREAVSCEVSPTSTMWAVLQTFFCSTTWLIPFSLQSWSISALLFLALEPSGNGIAASCVLTGLPAWGSLLPNPGVLRLALSLPHL